MNTGLIDKAFEELIAERGIYLKLKETQGSISQLRFKLKNNIPISTDLKLRLLQKSGWTQPAELYSQVQVVDAISFALRSNEAARKLGAAHLFQKWKAKN